MKREIVLKHEFVEVIPKDLKDGVIYVSIPYATAAHKCCCGCGNEVITPITPTDWQLSFDGESVSLDPSIGNWSFACKSHYWITNNKVEWATRWSQKEIETGRARDQRQKQRYFDKSSLAATTDVNANTKNAEQEKPKSRLRRKLKKLFHKS